MFRSQLIRKSSLQCWALVSTQPSTRNWKVLKLNHIAIATNGVDKAAHFFRDVLGNSMTMKQTLPEHGVNVVVLDVKNTCVELLDRNGMDKSPIASFLEKNPAGGIHHVCLEVDNIQEAMKDLKERGIKLLSEGTRIGAHGKPVVFLHPKDCSGVLVELEQS